MVARNEACHVERFDDIIKDQEEKAAMGTVKKSRHLSPEAKLWFRDNFSGPLFYQFDQAKLLMSEESGLVLKNVNLERFFRDNAKCLNELIK